MLLGILSIIIGYLLGSIPTAYIVSRMRKGIDIRNVGSGNMGAANVIRRIGAHEGVFVGLIDIAKGAVAILIAQTLNISELWVFGTGFGVLVGHNFPVFAGFRGGRGSATVNRYRYLSRANPLVNARYAGNNSYSVLYYP